MIDVIPVVLTGLTWAAINGMAYRLLNVADVRQRWKDYYASAGYKYLQERQRIAKMEKREDRRHRREVLKIAQGQRKKIIEAMTHLGKVHIKERNGGRVKYDRVKLNTILLGTDWVTFRIDRRPWKITPHELVEDQFVEDLRAEVGRPDLEIRQTPYDGQFVYVPLRGAAAGIPEFVPWLDGSRGEQHHALGLLPAERKFAVPIGLGENRKFYYLDLATSDGPHLLIAGTTGAGKTVCLNQIICTLIRRNTPSRLQMAFIDLKRVEMWSYRNIPHLWRPVITHAHQVADLLKEVQKEMNRRQGLLQQSEARDIEIFNEANPGRQLPRLVVIFDEIANIMLNKDLKGPAESLLADLSALGRAFGIHLILCTQRPSADVVTGLIKTNVTTRVCYRTDKYGSMTVLDNANAKELKQNGRAVLQVTGRQYTVQTPYISDKQIKEAVTVAHSLKLPTAEWTDQDVLEDILTTPGTEREITERLADKPGVTPALIRRVLREYQFVPAWGGPVLTINDHRVVLHNGRMIAVNNDLPKSWQDLDIMETLQDGLLSE